jgi:hypothetical protein
LSSVPLRGFTPGCHPFDQLDGSFFATPLTCPFYSGLFPESLSRAVFLDMFPRLGTLIFFSLQVSDYFSRIISSDIFPAARFR